MIDEQPATAEQVQAGLDAYVGAVRAHYGSRLKDIILFGTRPRADASPESDADLAIILQDGDWVLWRERTVLADLTYEPLVEFGLSIRAWPVSQAAWIEPARHRDPGFVHLVKEYARPLEELVSDYRKWRAVFPPRARAPGAVPKKIGAP